MGSIGRDDPQIRKSISTVRLSMAQFSYTSLRDLLLSSPRPSPCAISVSCHDITIRNRLVKHAAWAYLQPMSRPMRSNGQDFFKLVRNRLSLFAAFLKRAAGWVYRAFCIGWRL
ncbi:hypothetical protein MRB53_023845 [Persea americana]|uniref:Uncharacterized protein n=1 Tax=Persea americana TaxID=3435 RepID=A0ACC2LAH3_PERAE|nr:hypothetical protein MRB53_023845 [Persea americana]